MDTLNLMFIIGAFLIGALGAWLVAKKHNTVVEQEEESPALPQVDIPHISEEELHQKEEEIKSLSAQVASLKEKQVQALAAADKQIKSLEEQLSNSLNGHVDSSISAQLEETKKLKKKISDLEEEIEDNEDDIADLQKKLKNEKTQKEELQEAADKSVRKLKVLNEQYERVNAELEDHKKENNQITEALAFVTEILTAKLVSDNSTKNLFDNVDALANYIREDVKVCAPQISPDYFGTELDSWAINKKKSWLQGKTTIALVGEFSAGKTSIVNRILSQDNPNIPQLPVSTKATTAIPTYITGGVGALYRFVSPDNEQKNISEKTFKRVNKEVLDRIDGMSSLIKYFVMTYKNPNLNNLSILDTPGFNSNDKEDAERTIEVINECDALFWVVDVNSGTVNRSSLKLIKEHLKRPLYVVINKIDTKAKSEIDAVQNLINKTFKEEGVSVQGFVRFSAKADLNDIMSVIKGVKRDSAKDTYMEHLIEAVQTIKKTSEKEVKDAEEVCQSLLDSSNNITDSFNEAMGNLAEDCETAAGIPHFEEHLFRKDNYEMSQEEYGNLVDVLQQICGEDCDSLANLYNAHHEETEKLNDAWHEYAAKTYDSQQLNDCYESLKKKYQRLNAISNGK